MNVKELIAIALNAKVEFCEHVDIFIAKLQERCKDPNDPITMREFEELRKITGLSNDKTLTNMSSKALELLDTKELNDSKKGFSSSLELS